MCLAGTPRPRVGFLRASASKFRLLYSAVTASPGFSGRRRGGPPVAGGSPREICARETLEIPVCTGRLSDVSASGQRGGRGLRPRRGAALAFGYEGVRGACGFRVKVTKRLGF